MPYTLNLSTHDFDGLLEVLWSENAGGLAWRLLHLSLAQRLPQPPQLVLREMLALSMCHSKSKVRLETLTDVHRLRATMQRSVGTALPYLYHLQQVAQAEHALAQAQHQDQALTACRHKLDQATAALRQWQDGRDAAALTHARVRHYYQDFAHDAFAWLVAPEPAMQELVVDVIDTLRALRCADALRERGTTFRTSAGYEVFLNRENAHAVYALRSRHQSTLFLLEGRDPISAGEVNLTSAGLDSEGHPLPCPGALQAPTTCEADRHILVEGVEDNAAFAALVCQELRRLHPALAARVHVVASLQHAELHEVNRYLDGRPLHWSTAAKAQLLAQMAATGHKVDPMDLVKAFQEVRIVSMKAGEMLLPAAAPSRFVYIPLGAGLHVFPLGTPASFPALPWVPMGHTGVIRGAMRNARVMAEHDVELLSIPKEVYLQHWYRPYTVHEYTALCAQGTIQAMLPPA